MIINWGNALTSALCLFSGIALAQPAAPGANGIPEKPEQRTWYPRADVYFPEQIVGSWVRYKDGVLEFLTPSKPPTGTIPKPVLLNSIRAYTVSINKGDEGKAGIPGFASVSLKDSEAQSLTIDDIAAVSLGQGANDLFCRDWSILKNAVAWKEKDEIRYINAALLSHVSWKVGKEHAKGADVGIDGIFNASGKQYDQSSVSGTLPAVAITTTLKEITKADLAGRSCSPGHRTRMVSEYLSTNNPVLLKDVIKLPDR